MLLALFILITSTALLAGMAWSLYGRLPDRVDGFIVALSGGALLLAAILELVQPVIANQSVWGPLAAILAGGVLYNIVNEALARSRTADQAGMISAGLLLNGVPENMAVGITLIGHEGMAISALAGSIFLANVPEAAGATRSLVERGYRPMTIWALWGGLIAALAVAALAGRLLFSHTDPVLLGYLRCFAAGAIVASLAIDVFPRAFQARQRLSGIATTLGLVLALALNLLG